jgi:hypothetical protein
LSFKITSVARLYASFRGPPFLFRKPLLSAKNRAQLRALEPLEKRFLFYLFEREPITVKEIALKLEKGESTTYAIQSGICTKLGITEREDKKKRRDLLVYKEDFQTLYPSIEAIEASIGSPEAPPAPPPIERQINISPQEPRTNPTFSTTGFLVGLLIISACVIVALLGIIIRLNGNHPASIPPTDTQAAFSALVPTTAVPTIAPTRGFVQLPTLVVIPPSPTATWTPPNTPVPTATSVPTTTSIPTATPVILFQDDFDNGLSPQWNVLGGEYSIINDMVTTNEDVGLRVGDSSWGDYKVQMRVKPSGGYWTICFAAHVNASSNFLMNCFDYSDAAWGYGSYGNSFDSIGEYYDIDIDEFGTVEMTAVGGNFTFTLNGVEFGSANEVDQNAGGVYVYLGFDSFLDWIKVIALP